MEKSGIYKINCDTCNSAYIGQTRRMLKTRFKEHFSHYKNNIPEKSSVAQHLIQSGHEITLDNMKLIKNTSNNLLDAYESIFILKNKGQKLLNSDSGPITHSPLFSLLNHE